MDNAIRIDSASAPVTPCVTPAATDELLIQILNGDATHGVANTIFHLPPRGDVSAHRHQAGLKIHFILKGDLNKVGQN